MAAFSQSDVVQVQQGCQQMGVELPETATTLLLQYLQLLQRWNRVYNLTAIRDPDRMLTHHLLDSLSVAPFLQGERILDVGTGAGLPGIPLASAFPNRDFVLLDTNSKKTRFVKQAVIELALKNVEVVQKRVQEYQPRQLFDTIVSRAFASLMDFQRNTAHLCNFGARLIAMKGQSKSDELRQKDSDWSEPVIQEIKVPGLDAKRHIVIMEPSITT